MTLLIEFSLKLEDVCYTGRKYCYDDVLRAIFTQKSIPKRDSNPQLQSDRW